MYFSFFSNVCDVFGSLYFLDSITITVSVQCFVHPCHHGMARPRVADGGYDSHIWMMAANILNKHWRTADKRWSSSFGVGLGG
jgi:hypothetical protein